jgi:hypothetical protein
MTISRLFSLACWTSLFAILAGVITGSVSNTVAIGLVLIALLAQIIGFLIDARNKLKD